MPKVSDGTFNLLGHCLKPKPQYKCKYIPNRGGYLFSTLFVGCSKSYIYIYIYIKFSINLIPRLSLILPWHSFDPKVIFVGHSHGSKSCKHRLCPLFLCFLNTSLCLYKLSK